MSGKIGEQIVNILPGSRMRGPLREVTVEPAAPGVDGMVVTRGAKRMQASTYATEVTCQSRAAAEAAISAYEALQGETLDVTDEDGTVHRNVIVVSVRCEDPDRFAFGVGVDTNGDTWRVRAVWSFLLPFTTTPKGALSR